LPTIVCCGTGPSITPHQVEVARRRGWALFVCNDAICLAPDAALLHACNWQWWDARWAEVKDLPCEKWTTRKESAEKYGIHWIAEVNRPGLSNDPALLHHGHSSGYQLLGMAYRAGATRIVLLGYDMSFAPDYDGAAHQIGSSPRHFFGEYEPELQHWPRVQVRNGVHIELFELYRSVADQGAVEIINCSGGVLDCFPRMDINDVV
jgi:hypothetical protein